MRELLFFLLGIHLFCLVCTFCVRYIQILDGSRSLLGKECIFWEQSIYHRADGLQTNAAYHSTVERTRALVDMHTHMTIYYHCVYV